MGLFTHSSWAREGDIYKTRLDNNLSSITYNKILLKLVSNETGGRGAGGGGGGGGDKIKKFLR
jgi:hypothetical protein